MNELVTKRQWVGLLVGLLGISLVLSGRVQAGFTLAGIGYALIALFGITLGTLYQKKFCPPFDWRTGAVVQFIPAAIVTFVGALLTENFNIEFVPQFNLALAWLVIVLSVGAISLLNYLIRIGSAVNVASLFYLVPASTAAIAWMLFDEKLSAIALAGMVLTILGVWMARR